MGRSDPDVFSFYRKHIKPKGSVALLGWTDNFQYKGDLYDLQLKNWDINSDWSLKKKYDIGFVIRRTPVEHYTPIYKNKEYYLYQISL